MKGVIKKLNEKQWDKEILKNVEILQEVAEDIEKQKASIEKGSHVLV